MQLSLHQLYDRAERYLPSAPGLLSVDLLEDLDGVVENISCSGIACSYDPKLLPAVTLGAKLPLLRLRSGDEVIDCGAGRIARTTIRRDADGAESLVVGVAFEQEQPGLIARLGGAISPYAYVTAELSRARPSDDGPEADARDRTIDEFYRKDDPDVFAKCRTFRDWIGGMQQGQIYQRMYRVTITGPLDSHVTIFDPITRRERVMRCFDSNSYLGLHRHPKVNAEVQRVLSLVGYGTPSAQLLCGTNRYLRELEETLSAMHHREETMVFPTGFAANIGAINALARSGDAVIHDRYAHASIQEGCRSSAARFDRRFEHNDLASLDRVLSKAAASGCKGKLVATDGVFSMNGDLAPVPELLDVCRKHGARLMIDDAHGLGVLGARGRGIEEHFGIEGQVDVLMGTLSKAVGSIGGYISGSRDLVSYLRWFAGSGLFTTALPAAICAGMQQSLLIMQEEPEHRTALWDNTRYFVRGLQQVGFAVPDAASPIITVFVGPQRLMWDVSRALFEAGIKCGNVIYPAVAKNETILRFTMNSRHTREDLDVAIEALQRIGTQLDFIGRVPSVAAQEAAQGDSGLPV